MLEVERFLAGWATALSGRASTGTLNGALGERTIFRKGQPKSICFLGNFAHYGDLLEQLGKLLFQQ